MKQKIQLIEKQVEIAGQSVDISEELDKSYSKVTGISLLDNISADSLFSSSNIDGMELFPKNFEVLFLQSNTFVPPDERFFSFDRPAEGKRLNLQFSDGGKAEAYPYLLKVYLRLEK